MLVVRPVKIKNLNQLYKLSALAKTGITTFPRNKNVLRNRIHESVRQFAKKKKMPKGNSYLFVMEDIKIKKIIGVCAIVSEIGCDEPSYTYEVKVVKKESKLLKVKKDIQHLQLKREYKGPSEIGTLFLHPGYRHSGIGRLLSLSRFLFMAEYRSCFKTKVIAELRGVVDRSDCSPFWNDVCKHFFQIAYKKADLMMMEDKTFIADLIPLHPIYIPLLPQSARKVLGRVHKNTLPALNLLKQEGFEVINEIDIFEAGPVCAAKVKDIRTVKRSQCARVKDIVLNITTKTNYLIANVITCKKFCVVMGNLNFNGNGVTITKDVANALGVDAGDKVRVVKARG